MKCRPDISSPWQLAATAGFVVIIGLFIPAVSLSATLPSSSAQYGPVQTQRIRFENAPLFKQANEAVIQRDDAVAIMTFRKILENDPGNNQAKLSLIVLYERQGRYPEGLALCDELIRLYPGFTDAYQFKGNIAMKNGQFDLAAAAWEEELKRLPVDNLTRRRAILFSLGQAYSHALRYRDAERVYAQVLAISFDEDTALSYFYALKAVNEPEKGRSFLERLLAVDTAPILQRRIIYELALMDRRAGQKAEYFRRMEMLIEIETDSRRLQEHGFSLYGAGNLPLALQALIKSFDLKDDPQSQYETGLFIAEIYLQQKRVDKAQVWLGKIAPLAGADTRWALAMARADFFSGNYRACFSRLIALPEQPASIKLLAGMAFMNEGMQGPALECFNAVNPDLLLPDERLSFYRNRAYLNYDQSMYREAFLDAEDALDGEPSSDMALLCLKALANLQCYDEVEEIGQEMLKEKGGDWQLTSREKAQVFLVTGRCLYLQKHYEPALERMTNAFNLDRSLTESLYINGLIYHARGEYKEAVTNYQAYLGLNPAPPATFWGDYGHAAGAQRDFDRGTRALDRSLEYYAVDVKTLAERGYQFMKWNHNESSRESFRRAIDYYTDLVPRVPTNETAVYRKDKVAMKKEYTKLDHLFGIQAYLSRTDYGFPTNVGIASIEGALPSQGGLEASFRPPLVGFRNEKTLEIFGDILGNFKRRTWSPDPDSYQGMVGARYKPLARVNYNMSFARLMKIGDNSENNWLWRNLASWEQGAKPAGDKRLGLNLRIFGDVGYYFIERARWYGYFDSRAGPSLKLTPTIFLTIPQFMGLLRFETDDDIGTGSYVIGGLGANLRLYEPERRYVINRVYLDLFAYYTVGTFESTPQGFDRRSFDGVMIELNLVK